VLLPTSARESVHRVYRASNSIPPLLGMAIRRAISQDGLGGFMKKFLVVSALVLSSSCLASAQSTEPQNRDNNATRYDEQHRNWSWLGLLGLAGLGGLARRKSETAQRFESRGVNAV
jgi:MYXO-CTERM domain-containing protein